MAIKLPPETSKQLVASIRRYFAGELDQDVGDLKAGAVLDYVLREIGPSVYNRAIADAQSYLHERVVDLDGVCHEPELTFWRPPGKGR
jgi:uncharacterized protein (DUF2164 family)